MKNITKLILTILISLALVGCSTSSTTNNEVKTSTNRPKIALITLMEHTSLNTIRDAFLQQMETLGYSKDSIEIFNAQGETANLTTIVQTIAGSNYDGVIAITTPAAQAAINLAESGIPVIFSAVTDPISAGVVESLTSINHGMSGTSDAVAMDRIMQLALTFYPQATTFGYLYNPGEDNSVANLNLVEQYCQQNGYTLITQGATNASELPSATTTLASEVDVIICGNDNTVAESMPTVVNAANQSNTPIFVGADSMVIDGALATVGIDYTDLGKESANMLDKVLNGTKIQDIPVKVFNEDLYIYVNQKELDTLGLQLPETIKNNEKLILIED